MFQRDRISSHSTIGNNSNNNSVFQGNSFENTTIIASSNIDVLDIAAQVGRYDIIQSQVALYLEKAKRCHPLFPEFSAKYNEEVNKLISTPETADAFRNHPKRIKGTYRLDYGSYPYMDKSETPWAYAYRTQTTVMLDTTSYQEFLGEMEDPFPILTYTDGMKTSITPPTFPDAVEATIVSGEIAIPFMLRRLPCMEFGWLRFGSVSTNQGFDIVLSTNDDASKTTITITKTTADSLQTHLLREQLLFSMVKTKNMRILISGNELLNASFTDKDLEINLFIGAESLSGHFERLLFIERETGCHFNPNFDDLSIKDYNTAILLSSSLNGKWHKANIGIDNNLRSNYDRIDEQLLEDDTTDKFSTEASSIKLKLHEYYFTADSGKAIYEKARISNIGSVRRAVRLKRENIKIVIKPIHGRKAFTKYVLLQGVKLLQNN